MADVAETTRSRREEWYPEARPDAPPIWKWPPRPLAIIKFIFGNTLFPADRWFGTFHDGSPEAQKKMLEKFRARQSTNRIDTEG